MAKKKTSTNLILTELSLFRADWGRTFMGEIRREKDEHGKDIIIGKVVVEEAIMWSAAPTLTTLRVYLDSMIILKLDFYMHSMPHRTARICDSEFNLN
jgi:hypothetical protein